MRGLKLGPRDRGTTMEEPYQVLGKLSPVGFSRGLDGGKWEKKKRGSTRSLRE